MFDRIQSEEFFRIWSQNDGVHLVDVREPAEYEQAHIPGSRLVPLRSLPLKHEGIPRGVPVYLICAGGVRSAQAAQWLAQEQGHENLINVEGGIMAWMRAGHPVVSGMEEAI